MLSPIQRRGCDEREELRLSHSGLLGGGGEQVRVGSQRAELGSRAGRLVRGLGWRQGWKGPGLPRPGLLVKIPSGSDPSNDVKDSHWALNCWQAAS